MAGVRVTAARVRIESALAVVSGGLGLLTLFWRDWLEAFGFDPDNGSGLVEWAIVAGLLLAAVSLGATARAHRRLLVQPTG